jgi:hypothetical protein
MNHLSRANLLKGTAALALLFFCSMGANAQNADCKKISNLFAEIKTHSRLAVEDAELLESYTRSDTSWESHSHRLAQVKDHVDDLLADYNQAQLLREEGSKWQQEGIDELRPVLKAMAEHLTTTILHMNENPTQVKQRQYVDYVRQNREYVEKSSSLIHDLVDYGAAKSTAESLETLLKLPSRSDKK